MELREYLAIRRAYSLVRQGMPTNERLTFVEFAILCRMRDLDRPMSKELSRVFSSNHCSKASILCLSDKI